MIKIDTNLYIREIQVEDMETLFSLMQEIYPFAYKHFWEDNGEWYLYSQYSKENILKEIHQENTSYYFVVFNDEIIGNFRFLWDENLKGLSDQKQVKLHRLYVHQKLQGKGIGKKLVSWLEKKAQQKGYEILWMDTMDAQPQAFQFYKKQGYNYHSHTILPFARMHNHVRKMSQVYKKLL